jgi:hypothetical protein
MSDVNPDSYCGIYCAACSVRMYGHTGNADGFVAGLGSVPKEEIACSGCKSGNVYPGCRICTLRECAVKKGLAHCAECADYPCKMYQRWQSGAKIVPHAREAISSSEMIKRDGANAWITAQQKRWSCPDCGEPFSWYAAACRKCGRDLASEAYEISGWRKLVFRMIFPMAYRRGKAKRQQSLRG